MLKKRVFPFFLSVMIIYLSFVTAFAETSSISYSIEDFNVISGSWTVDNSVSSLEDAPSMIVTDNSLKDFVYTVKVNTAKLTSGEIALIFRYNTDNDYGTADYYSAAVDLEASTGTIYKYENDEKLSVSQSGEIEIKDEMTLKVIAVGMHLSFYADDVLICDSPDYNGDIGAYGQNTYISQGATGLYTDKSEVEFLSLNYSGINSKNVPYLKSVKVSSENGAIESAPSFDKKQLIYQFFADNKTSSVSISGLPVNETTNVTLTDENGATVNKKAALIEGQNTFYLTAENNGAVLRYQINVFKRGKAESYYNEDYRNQYHYSAKDGVSLSPAGLVKVGDTYHKFYRYKTEVSGEQNVLWGHATSTDLVKWTEQPIAFEPDEYGDLLTGSIVYDENNTSGLFKEGKGGLVCLMAVSGNGNRITGAYSEDEGFSWKKLDSVVLNWSDSALQDKSISYPTVFRYADKWFMLLGGEAITIYSSENLLDWNIESTYSSDSSDSLYSTGINIQYSKPTFFRAKIQDEPSAAETQPTAPTQSATDTQAQPLQQTTEPETTAEESQPTDPTSAEENPDDNYRWVLVNNGRSYKVGTFTNVNTVNNRWEFIPDSQYSKSDGTLNFGSDCGNLAVYSLGEYDNEQNDVIAVSTLDCSNYTDDLNKATNNNRFTGGYSLNMNLSLTSDSSGKYLLVQTPAEGYEKYYDSKNTFNFSGTVSNKDKNILSDLKLESYVIEAKILPQGAAVVGFNVKASDNCRTSINYYTITQEIAVDRSSSGIIPSPKSKFSKISTQPVTNIKNDDGSITLKIYVDKSSVELFACNGTMLSSMCIYPDKDANGMEFYTVGGAAEVDISVTPIKSAWDKVSVKQPEKEKNETTEPTQAKVESKKNILDELDIVIVLIITLGVALIGTATYVGIKNYRDKKRGNTQ